MPRVDASPQAGRVLSKKSSPLSAACSRQSLPSLQKGRAISRRRGGCRSSSVRASHRGKNRCEIAISPVFIVFALWSSGLQTNKRRRASAVSAGRDDTTTMRINYYIHHEDEPAYMLAVECTLIGTHSRKEPFTNMWVLWHSLFTGRMPPVVEVALHKLYRRCRCRYACTAAHSALNSAPLEQLNLTTRPGRSRLAHALGRPLLVHVLVWVGRPVARARARR